MFNRLRKAINYGRFRRLLISIEEITKQENLHEVDFMAGYCTANIEEAKRNKYITKLQAQTLNNMTLVTVEETRRKIKRRREEETKKLIVGTFIKNA